MSPSVGPSVSWSVNSFQVLLGDRNFEIAGACSTGKWIQNQSNPNEKGLYIHVNFVTQLNFTFIQQMYVLIKKFYECTPRKTVYSYWPNLKI